MNLRVAKMEELVIKVPAPFAGTDEVGFSTRYPEQALHEPLRDVSFFVEGTARAGQPAVAPAGELPRGQPPVGRGLPLD